MGNCRALFRLCLVLLFGFMVSGCGTSGSPDNSTQKNVVVTYSILGALVKDVVGNAAAVTVLMPNGVDPHDWAPSAKDIELLNNADLVITNGLGLEGGLQDVLTEAIKNNVPVFVATDHIKPRLLGQGEGTNSTDADQATGAADPHIWTDPTVMSVVLEALSDALAAVNIEVSEAANMVSEDLVTLDHEIEVSLQDIPDDRRKIVTGHESLGYFARRYHLQLVGAIVPSLSSTAEASAADLSDLKRKIKETGVSVIFTESGTSPNIVKALAADADVLVVELSIHFLPEDGTYRGFMMNLASAIEGGLVA